MQDLITEYRELLIADESAASVDRAIDVLSRAASGNGKHWLRLTPLATKTTDRTSRVTWFLSKFNSRLGKKREELPDDQFSFLADSLLLLFHHAYFGLLPHVNGQREQMLRQFDAFAASLSRPADKFQTAGLIAMHRKQWTLALDSFRTAVAATHSDDHDFMTRVQMMWLILIERRRMTEALEFLMDVQRKASFSDLDEIQSLIRETFHEVVRGNRQSTKRAV